jgi:hypothetical protein
MLLPRDVRRLASCAARINLEKTGIKSVSYKHSFSASDALQHAAYSKFMSFLEITSTTMSVGLMLPKYHQFQLFYLEENWSGEKVNVFWDAKRQWRIQEIV